MSGIYIPGMEMPTGCGKCPFEIFGDCYGGKVKRIMDVEDYIDACCRHPKCPLIPVPDHGRLIDADNLIKIVGKATVLDSSFKWKFAALVVEEPTIIPASKEGET